MTTRPFQAALSLALSLAVTLVMLASIDTLATQPEAAAQMARSTVPASAPAHS